MKKYKAVTIALLAVSIAVPAAADAAWYNPFSWFKKKETPAVINATSSTVVKGSGYGDAVDTVTPAATSSKEVKVTAPKPVGTVPPVKSVPVPPSSGTTRPPKQDVSNPAVPATTTATTTAKEAKVVEVPSFKSTYNFQPSTFVQPFNIRTGTELLAVEATHGSGTAALGQWYVESVTWRIVSDEMRSGDIVIGVSSKQNVVVDSDVVNAPVTTRLSAHVASDELSFKINGAFPSRGRVHLVVDEISGYMKGDATKTVYKFKGLPVTGPEFSL